MIEDTGMTHLASSAKRKIVKDKTDEGRSLTKTIKRSGPRMLPWGTPERTGRTLETD